MESQERTGDQCILLSRVAGRRELETSRIEMSPKRWRAADTPRGESDHPVLSSGLCVEQLD